MTNLALIYHYYFFIFHIIDLLFSSEILRKILYIIFNYKRKIIGIFVFVFVFLYFFSLVVFYYFNHIYPEYQCSSLYTCLVILIDSTKNVEGGIYDFYSYNDDRTKPIPNFGRYLIDIMFTLIFIWILNQFISSIFIDLFSSSRENQNKLRLNYKNLCTICMLDRIQIDKIYLNKSSFKDHISDHFLNNYLMFLFYLYEKDKKHMNGFELYISGLVDNQNIEWFPFKKCLKMEEED